MRPSFITIALFYASGILAASSQASSTPRLRRGCAAELRHAKIDDAEQHFVSHRTSSEKVGAYTIAVYWHVIRQNNTIRGGNLPDSQISDQIQVLNSAYSSSGIRFVHAGTTRTTNSTWFNEASDGEGDEIVYQTDMKRALRKGGAAALNIYSVSFAETEDDTLLGYATFPYDYKHDPINDGAVVKFTTLPGGLSPYDLGQTTTHEVGHWLGLFHTFEGGCEAPGDYVDDTAPEARPAFGCPSGRQTCDGGDVDPIHNYMDYTNDACKSEFTPGQRQRMREQIALYRGIEAKVQVAHPEAA